jgi:hypothetical protein
MAGWTPLIDGVCDVEDGPASALSKDKIASGTIDDSKAAEGVAPVNVEGTARPGDESLCVVCAISHGTILAAVCGVQP